MSETGFTTFAPEGQEAEFWKRWVQLESCRRTGYAIWVSVFCKAAHSHTLMRVKDARYHVGISVSSTTETHIRGWKDTSSMSGSALGVKDSFAVAPHLPIFAV